jgi:molybdenum cofactor biosynthesis enzyme MoaA
MNNQHLLDNAPEGATHVDTEGDYHKIGTIYQYEDKSDCGDEDRLRLSNSGDWVTDSDDLLLTRSLADIKRIIELAATLKRLLDITVWVDSGCKQLGAAEQAAREALEEQGE